MPNLTINNITPEQQKEILALAEEIKKRDEGELNLGDKYWHIGDDGDVFCLYWFDSELSKERQAIGNFFKTKGEAEKAINWLKALASVRTYIKKNMPFEADWEDYSQEKWGIAYNHNAVEFFSAGNDDYQFNPLNLYVKSQEDANKLIEDMEKELLIIYGVNE